MRRRCGSTRLSWKRTNGLGIVYARRGDLGRARVQWETALRLDPSFETARRNLRILDQDSTR